MPTSGGERGLGNFAAGIVDKIKDVAIDINGVKCAGRDCYNAASETTKICDTATSKACEIIEFGIEVKSAFGKFDNSKETGNRDIPAPSTRAITGGQMLSVLETAMEMDELALACVEQSIKMIDYVSAGIESLPDILEKRIERRMETAQRNGSVETDPELPDLDADCKELERSIDSVNNENLLQSLDSFHGAFNGIIANVERCNEMFKSIRVFAKDIVVVSNAIKDFHLGNLILKIRDLIKKVWRCLRLSDLIRAFAEAVGRLIKWIIKVIQAVLEKIQKIEVGFENCGCCMELTSFLEQFGLSMIDMKTLSQSLLKVLAK
mmetsp:Transcript_3949/g.4290  ORF Transcript_3949/g.4290 Transcript_3949/m.4290 type:complete len:321 (+) Transcript_3949:146-1108(+)|eukprot:CAMPEP_0194357782 /NCGR_PEP_ID=MMETSP0174-20130528/5222_1 /TAXON_ID=216777 /ORGANISM="Proboscia alata, Strain PI-D3" /LENGTH=320 /DNA_ID=CAMNT_0039127951 /DNA_START=124 /DNA_END=1086 /DNA_ORIENTATION=+